ncbi:MAG: phosphoglycolate phosphatase [Hyphomicrobiales bacterium]|nr:HAD-IA family hydrolase [Ahrensia sp. AH-315-G08]PCH45690.1 MAG: phosphoglycolate phosphatase [Hyphomicrobiales bacterium]
MRPATIVFDLDGTLVHSAPDLGFAINCVLQELGVASLPLHRIESMIGNGMPKLFERALAASNLNLSPGEYSTQLENFLAIYDANIARETTPYSGVETLLLELREYGCKLAICTNKKQGVTLKLVAALGMEQSFDAIIGADEGRLRKPEAEPLLLAISQAGGVASNALMVGDSAADAQCAKAANVPCVLVNYGYSNISVTELPSIGVISKIAAVKQIAFELGLFAEV